MRTLRGKNLELLHTSHPENLSELLISLRSNTSVDIGADILHDPLLLPDIGSALERIAFARTQKQRVMIFGDYDVDGISSTAALFLFL